MLLDQLLVQLLLDVVERIDAQIVDLAAFPVVLSLAVVELLFCVDTHLTEVIGYHNLDMKGERNAIIGKVITDKKQQCY